MQRAVKINEKTLPTQTEVVLKNDALSKSQKMKDLFDLGYETKAVAEMLNVRYNFAYNVISNYVNMNKLEVVAQEKSGKKDQIIELHKAGKSNKEISIELSTNYNYVFNVLKTYKASLPTETIDLSKTNITPEVHAEDPGQDEKKEEIVLDLTDVEIKNTDPDTSKDA